MAEKIVKAIGFIVLLFLMLIGFMFFTDNLKIKVNEEFPPEKYHVNDLFQLLVREETESEESIFEFQIDSVQQAFVIKDFYIESKEKLNNYFIEINDIKRDRFNNFNDSLKHINISDELKYTYKFTVKDTTVVDKYVVNLNFCFVIENDTMKVNYSKFRFGI